MRDRPFKPAPPPKPEPRPCKACGIKLEWFLGPKGKYIPVQKVKVVYIVVRDLTGQRILQPWPGAAGEDVRISHFEGCPQADRFSKNKRGAQKPHA